jgi:hypothetical protein
VSMRVLANSVSFTALFFLVCAAAPGAAEAEDDKFSAAALKLPADVFISGWFIEPGPKVLPTEPLKGGQSIIETPFFPYKTYAIDAEINFDGMKSPLAVSTEMIGFIAHQPIACTEKAVSRSAGQALLLKGGTRHLCLIDTDKDGAFDRRFYVDNGSSLWTYQSLIPKDTITIEPVKYHETDRKTSSVARVLSLFYYSHHSWIKEFSIGFSFYKEGENTGSANGVTAFSFKDKDIPMTTNLFGGNYRIEKMEKGRILVQLEGEQLLTPIHLGSVCCGYR